MFVVEDVCLCVCVGVCACVCVGSKQRTRKSVFDGKERKKKEKKMFIAVSVDSEFSGQIKL